MPLKGAGTYMNGHMDTQWGRVSIDPEVIATYAGSVAVECFGIVGMAAVNMKDGLVKLLKRDYLTHGINVAIDEDNKITIDFHVIVSYGGICPAIWPDICSVFFLLPPPP